MAIKVGGDKLYPHQFCHFFWVYNTVGIVSSCFVGCKYKYQELCIFVP